jgi:hypothetical protein
MEEILMDGNEDVIVSLGLLDSEDGNNKFWVHVFLLFASFKYFFLEIWCM